MPCRGARTFRISSKSSLNASATDAIQNFRKRSFKTCSSCPAGANEGMSEGGGVGEGLRREGFRGPVSEIAFGESSLVGSTSESLSESDSDEEEPSELSWSCGCGCVFFAVFTDTRTTAC